MQHYLSTFAGIHNMHPRKWKRQRAGDVPIRGPMSLELNCKR